MSNQTEQLVAKAAGNVVDAQREWMDLSWKELQTLTKVNPETVKRWRRGETKPNLYTLWIIAEALGLHTSELVELIEEEVRHLQEEHE